MKFKSIIILVLVALFIIILVQNVQVISLRFLLWQISMSQILFIPFILIIGFILGFLTAKLKKKKS